MFIVTVTKKNKGSSKAFEYQHLLESIRTEKGPRQHFLLNLGKLELPREEWPGLAKRIDEILHGQETLFSAKPEIEQLASRYAQAIIRKYEAEYDDTPRDYQTVDIHSLEKSKERSIGSEYIAYSFLKKLEVEECLLDLFREADLRRFRNGSKRWPFYFWLAVWFILEARITRIFGHNTSADWMSFWVVDLIVFHTTRCTRFRTSY